MSQLDIRIGTLTGLGTAPGIIPQILPHGFESFALTLWENIGPIDLDKIAAQLPDVLAGKAVISSVGLFGNPLQNESTARDFELLIKKAPQFGTKLVCGFAGAVEGKPVPESMGQFKKIWGRLVKVAEDHGCRIAFENCDMAGTWDAPLWNIAHAPTAWEMLFNEVP